MTWRIEHGDCRAVMAAMEPESVDSIVTDPPYGLSFMGKEWDHGLPGVPFWTEALRVARPGAHLLAFGGTRTFHRLTCAIEDAGWEVRDCLMWLYGQGFPKSHNLDGEHKGWGTALKPAWEPIILARKPFRGTVAANVARFGTGAINVDACRVAWAGPEDAAAAVRAVGFADSRARGTTLQSQSIGRESRDGVERYEPDKMVGRWPANVVLDEEAAPLPGLWYGDSGGASRFFYTAKASRAEREAGLSAMPDRTLARSGGAQQAEANGTDYGAAQTIGLNRVQRVKNLHPTVKPVDLMCWLVRLVTPPGGLVLDPFAGSGTTGIAALRQRFSFIGIEQEADYVALARSRIAEDAPLFGRAEA